MFYHSKRIISCNVMKFLGIDNNSTEKDQYFLCKRCHKKETQEEFLKRVENAKYSTIEYIVTKKDGAYYYLPTLEMPVILLGDYLKKMR